MALSSGKSGAHSANQSGSRVFDSVALRLLRRGPSLTADWVNRMGAPKSYVSTSVVFGVCAFVVIGRIANIDQSASSSPDL
jgi:hypothetical protein